jgi:hypothetical protein
LEIQITTPTNADEEQLAKEVRGTHFGSWENSFSEQHLDNDVQYLGASAKVWKISNMSVGIEVTSYISKCGPEGHSSAVKTVQNR